MDITYLGVGAVRLSGRSLNIVADPYGNDSGLGKFSAKADVVTLSALQGLGAVAGAMTIDSPGEYEVGGATITGVSSRLHIDEAGQRGTVYSILIDGVNVVVTGNIAGKLAEDEVEALGKVDILVLPVGGYGLTLDAEGAAAVVAQLEPSYVVPVHYADPKTTYPMPQAPVEEFLSEMGVKPEAQPRLRVNAKELPEETQVALLTRVGV